MGFTEDYRKITKAINALHINDDFARFKLWDQETAFLIKHIDDAIKFVNEECTFDDFLDLSEVWDDVVEVTQSKEFLESLHEANKRFVEQGYDDQSNILYYADIALEPDWDENE